MLGSPSRTVLGRPYVPAAEVLTVVEEQVRDAKVIIFKKRLKGGYTKKQGHRQDKSEIVIESVSL
jgi:large subunit ribosomal protein L21